MKVLLRGREPESRTPKPKCQTKGSQSLDAPQDKDSMETTKILLDLFEDILLKPTDIDPYNPKMEPSKVGS